MRPKRNRTVLGAVFVLAAALSCSDFTGDVQGCNILLQYGQWYTGNEGSYEYYPALNGQMRCPVAIHSPGEQIIAGGTVVEKKSGVEFPTSRVAFQIANSAGDGLVANISPFQRFDIYESHANLFVDYRAATGTRSFSDHDVLNLAVREFCNCGYDRLVAQLKLAVTYRSDGPLRAVIAGNDLPVAGATTVWRAVSDNGGRPHQFAWYRDGVYVGSGESYTGSVASTPFLLRVDQTDTYGRTATASMWVNVGAVRASADGPRTVWISQGGGTWMASGRGGTPPYQFRWYRDGQAVGSGASWSGYPGEGMQDAAGAAHTTAFQVNGIGGVTCQPLPPATSCSHPANGAPIDEGY